MAEGHEEEGPIHQAPWVFYLTVAVSYGALALISFAKYITDGAELGELGYMFAVQAGVLTTFLVFFGGIVYIANKMTGATGGKGEAH